RLGVGGLHAEELLEEAVSGRRAFFIARAERPGTEHAPARGDGGPDRLSLRLREYDRRRQDEHALAFDRGNVLRRRVAYSDFVSAEEAAPRHEDVILVARLGRLEMSRGARALQEHEWRFRARGAAAQHHQEKNCA